MSSLFSAFFPIISIPTLREEGDAIQRQYVYQELYFYPHPPRGGRLDQLRAMLTNEGISIPTLREEGDCKNRDKISIFL